MNSVNLDDKIDEINESDGTGPEVDSELDDDEEVPKLLIFERKMKVVGTCCRRSTEHSIDLIEPATYAVEFCCSGQSARTDRK